MTIIALVSSILLGIVSLAIGYSQGGASSYSLWFLLLGAIWLVTHFRKWYWFSSIAFLIIVFAAALWRLARIPHGMDAARGAGRFAWLGPLRFCAALELRLTHGRHPQHGTPPHGAS